MWRAECTGESVHPLWLCLPASPVPRIKWRKVDGSLSPQWATAEPTLQIPSVSFEDEGTYECEAENSKGRDSVQGRIIVQGTRTPLPTFTLRKSIQKSGRGLGGPLLKPLAPGQPWVRTEEASAEASSALQLLLQKACGRLWKDLSC